MTCRHLAVTLAVLISAWFPGAEPAAAQLSPEAAAAAIDTGRAAMERRDWNTAIAAFDQALATPELAPAARFYIGLAREEAGQRAAAVEDYRAVLDMRPSAPGDVRGAVFDRLTLIGFDQLQNKDAAALATLDLAAQSGRFDALYYYGLAAAGAGDWAALQKAGERLLQIQPQSGEAWQFRLHALEQRAAAGGPGAGDDRTRAVEVLEQMKAQPVLFSQLMLGEEDGTHLVTATLTGNAAPAGSWCILDISLNMTGANWRAGVMVTAPEPGKSVEIRARPASNDSSGPPPVSERVYNIRIPDVYCEAPGAAAIQPAEARAVSLKGCPETESAARDLLRGRPRIGQLRRSGDVETSYPAGGVSLFGTPVSRMTVKDDLYRFGLSGAYSGHEKAFAKHYGTRCSEDGLPGYCVKSHDRKSGALASATLTEADWPEGMLPQQTYLRCLYW
jgi:hypothetical protein